MVLVIWYGERGRVCVCAGNIDFFALPASTAAPELSAGPSRSRAGVELSPSVESCGCGLGPAPVRLGYATARENPRDATVIARLGTSFPA